MTTKTLAEHPLPANPPGWKGNVYYPSGKVGIGDGYGIKQVSGKLYDLDVIFPVINEKPKVPIILNQPIPIFIQSVTSDKAIHPDTSQENVTDNLNLCVVCGSRVEGKRIDRHYCSARCRKRASRQGKQLVLTGVR
jgi:hypothetical protein